MEGEMQPADEGLCAPKMCSQQRGPYSSLKTFPNKRLVGKARFDRPTMVDIPLLGDGGGHHYNHNLNHHHPYQQQYQQQRQQLHHTSLTISSSSQYLATPQQQQRFPCDNRPSSRAATSTSATVGSVAAASLGFQGRVGSGTAVRQDPTYSPGRAALNHESPDCTYGISSENRLILDAFAQQCSRVLTLLNNNGRFVEPQAPLPSTLTSHIKQEDSCLSGPGGESRPVVGQGGHCPTLGTPRLDESSTVDPDDEAQHSHWSQQQTSAFLRIFTESLQSYLLTGNQQPHPGPGLEGERCPPAEPESGGSPGHNLGGWNSPAPSDSYGHPSSTLPEEEEEESCCPRCVELEQEVLCLQQENEELRNKMDNIPAPCQNVLDFFKTVLQHHDQFIQPMAEEQLTEGSKQLLGNYPLFITNKQWDEAVNSSKKDGRRLLRYLIRFVFTTDELKYSCGLGKRKRSVHSGEPGPERRPLNPVKVTCLRGTGGIFTKKIGNTATRMLLKRWLLQ
uniref:BEN domain containing 4 n=1 Tax=Hucho hucho TaxID=62062 RepID=A0A4W5KUB8_9TELE